MPGQVGNVLPAVAQRRQVDLERVEAEEQVFAEFVRRRSSCRRSRLVAQMTRTSARNGVGLADAADLARFQEAQQLHLDVLVQFAEFVEEQRAAVGDFEEALVVAVGAR